MSIFEKWRKLILDIRKKIKKNKLEPKEQEININSLPEKVYSTQSLVDAITFNFLFRTWIVILLIIYIGYIAANSLDILYTIFTAFIISIALEWVISFFSRWLYRSVSIIISYVLLFLFLILWFVILIPFLIAHISQITDLFSQKISILQNQLQNQSLSEFIKSLHLYPYLQDKLVSSVSNPEIADKIKEFLTVNVSNIVQTFGGYMKEISSFAINTISAVFSMITQIIMIFTLAVFFSFEKESVVYTIANLSSTPRNTALKLKKLYHQLWEWLKWQLLLWVFVWIAVYMWLWTLSLFWIDLQEKWTLALISWLMEFIPYLWPILWSIPSLLVAILNYWFSWFLIVWILFIMIQQFEGLLIPIIMGKAVGVNSLMVMIAMLIWAKVLWLVWIILAIPITVIISLLFEDQLKK